jgi:hypothetical protein
MRSRFLALAAIGLACAAIATPAASGDGGAGAVVLGWDGITAGAERYVAVPTVGWTAIQAIRRDGGRVVRFMTLKGSWGIPLVAYDGTTDGLMRDGRTLVLGQAAGGPYLRKQSSFAFVDMAKMRVLRRLRVPGHHAFDAMSPDGRHLYLVEYVSQSDFTRYRVRAYDLRAERLLPKPVNDKRASVRTMQGSPVARAKSPDGTWVYTLYGGAHHSFIHALDTRHVEAVCIDMPWQNQPKRLFEFRLKLDGEGHLVVRGPRGRTLVVVDRRENRVLSSVRNP